MINWLPADNISKAFPQMICFISNKISLTFVLYGPIDNKPSLWLGV